MDKIPEGLTIAEEHDYIRKTQIRGCMDQVIDWLINLRPEWYSKVDLTFANVHTGPEAAEKAVRWWLRLAAPGSWAICGLEQQQRGTWHAHIVLDRYLDFRRGRELWSTNGFSWMQKIRNQRDCVRYAVKHAVKFGDFQIYEPGAKKKAYTTGKEKLESAKLSGKLSPNEYERLALEEIRRNGCNAKPDGTSQPRTS